MTSEASSETQIIAMNLVSGLLIRENGFGQTLLEFLNCMTLLHTMHCPAREHNKT